MGGVKVGLDVQGGGKVGVEVWGRIVWRPPRVRLLVVLRHLWRVHPVQPLLLLAGERSVVSLEVLVAELIIVLVVTPVLPVPSQNIITLFNFSLSFCNI